ncbi:MAG: DUF447 family protein [Planctomycetaceae bacterium]|nr:DUF447 family protein [Planctomycetaceae bacterium]
MIVECLVSTQSPGGELNVAPMGPRFDDHFDWRAPIGKRFLLSPFEPSRTLANLQTTHAGVLNFTDNVLLFAQLALKGPSIQWPPCEPTEVIAGQRMIDAARCWEFQVLATSQAGPRWHCQCEVVHVVEQRPMVLFNRAMHAVIEATILATRIGILPDEQIRTQIASLAPLIEKTAGPEQRAAWNWVNHWVAQNLSQPSATAAGATLTPSNSLEPRE